MFESCRCQPSMRLADKLKLKAALADVIGGDRDDKLIGLLVEMLLTYKLTHVSSLAREDKYQTP